MKLKGQGHLHGNTIAYRGQCGPDLVLVVGDELANDELRQLVSKDSANGLTARTRILLLSFLVAGVASF